MTTDDEVIEGYITRLREIGRRINAPPAGSRRVMSHCLSAIDNTLGATEDVLDFLDELARRRADE